MRFFILLFKNDPSKPISQDNIATYSRIRSEDNLDEIRKMAPDIEGSFIAEVLPFEGVEGWTVREMDIRPKIEKLQHDDVDIIAMSEDHTDKINEIIDHLNWGLAR